ncbi:MAG: PH domain-containing protein [Planctomycetota bacterium]|nr:PH domain-containing protein [Planctomycetota bacterium]MCZ6542917.1 PH domain-containing protein [Planctomycetota bacterium]
MSDAHIEEFSWHAHPAGERIGAAVGAVVVVIAVTGAIYLAFQSIAWSLLALVVLIATLNRFFFPSRFSIDPDGITARYLLRTQRYRWKDLRRFVVDKRGGYLSTRSRRSWLDAYRGLHVLFGEHRTSVIERIRCQLPQGGDS